jgi:hypothetical protein
LTVAIDRTDPTLVGALPVTDRNWHATNISTTLTAGDTLSGVVSDTVEVSTHVAINTEDSDARLVATVLDRAGNRISAEGKGGFKIDRKSPDIAMLPIDAGVYFIGQEVAYRATDKGSGVESIHGNFVNRSHLSAAGQFTLTVNATDKVGNQSERSAHFTVQYQVGGLSVPLKSLPAGQVVPITLRAESNDRENLSAGNLPVKAVQVFGPGKSGLVPRDVHPQGSDSSAFLYNEKKGNYSYNLDTRGYPAGEFLLHILIGNEVIGHDIPFKLEASVP